MGTRRSPERKTEKAQRARNRCRKSPVDLSHTTAVQHPLVGVSNLQHTLLAVARDFRADFGEWPTSAELAVAADVTRPTAWTELRALERLGLVAWRKKVEVCRAPDGVVFFVPRCGASSRDPGPAAGPFCASVHLATDSRVRGARP